VIHGFGEFELDEAKRELRLAGTEIPVQPRVFDVLVYLVSHRDRVVPKGELLDAIWPDVVVSDGSLKRAVSLARSALREGGLEDAIRNYARQGYRFVCEEVISARPSAQERPPVRLDGARGAYAAGRWTDAAQCFAELDVEDALAGDDLELWASALQLSGRAREALSPLERAVAAHGASADGRGLARACTSLALIHFEHMDMHVARGWLHRAERVLPAEPVGREHGVLASLASRFAVGEGRLDEAVARGEEGLAIARSIGDLDVELFALAYLGIALVARGEIARGLAVHDEAAAVALSGCASPLTNGMVYCGLIWTCRNRGDWQRAAEWTDSFARWCGERTVHLYSGTCRLHRAEVLRYRGALDEAEREAEQACRALSELAPYAEGDACRVLGDLRLEQGDLEAADKAYRRAHELGWDPQPGLARLLVARGKAAAGLQSLERSLEETRWANRQRRGLLLAHLARVALAAGRPERARRALAELEALPDLWNTTSLEAEVHEARAELLATEGREEAAIPEIRASIQGWHRTGSGLQVARQRLRLAELLLAQGDLEGAELELGAARAGLRGIAVPPLVERLTELEARFQRRGEA